MIALTLETRQLYASPNGDRWDLALYRDSGRVFVQHVPNAPSGGQPTNIELADFLSRSGNAPEQQALIRLIGTLVGNSSTQDNLAQEPERPPAGLQGPLSPTD
jgi:hypothetical protein